MIIPLNTNKKHKYNSGFFENIFNSLYILSYVYTLKH